jgi:hypothetical protein
MMMETNIARTSAQRAAAASQTKPADEKTGQTTQAAKRAVPDHGHIAERAYELYMQRGRNGSTNRAMCWGLACSA